MANTLSPEDSALHMVAQPIDPTAANPSIVPSAMTIAGSGADMTAGTSDDEIFAALSESPP